MIYQLQELLINNTMLGVQLTAGVTGKGGNWRGKPPNAESAVWGR